MVFTLGDSTVFLGSHFYHGRCLRRHMFNLIITAALPELTNTAHNECAISIISNVLEMIRKACLKPEAIPGTSSTCFRRLLTFHTKTDSMWNHLPDVRKEEGMKDALILCVVARLLPVIFHMLQESKDDLHTISDNALKLAKQIKASERHQFSTLAVRDLDFFDKVYLQQVLSVYVGMLALGDMVTDGPDEEKGYERHSTHTPGMFGERLPKPTGDGLSDKTLDLDVDYDGGFVFTLAELD